MKQSVIHKAHEIKTKTVQVVAFGLFLIDGPANKSRGDKKGPSSRLLKMNDRSLSIQRFDRLFKVILNFCLSGRFKTEHRVFYPSYALIFSQLSPHSNPHNLK